MSNETLKDVMAIILGLIIATAAIFIKEVPQEVAALGLILIGVSLYRIRERKCAHD